MKRLILHIGTYKTGSTSLQKFLAENAKLIADQGICYPLFDVRYDNVKRSSNAFFLTSYARSKLNVAGVERKETDVNTAAFKGLVDEFDTFVLSDERLWRQGANHAETWELLKDYLVGLGIEDIDIVVYLRRQDQFIESLWNQYVKSKMQLSVPLDEFVNKYSSKRVMNYNKCLEALEKAFGHEHMKVRLFNRSALVGGDIRRDFCELVGIDIGPEFTFHEDDSNTRLNDNIVEMKLVANQVPSYGQTGNMLYWPAVKVSRLFPDEGGSQSMTPELRSAILRRYQKGNARIARDFLGRDDGELFAPPSELDTQPEDARGDTFNRDAVALFAEALASEHLKRSELEATVKELETTVEKFEATVEELEKRVSELGQQVTELQNQMSASLFKRMANTLGVGENNS